MTVAETEIEKADLAEARRYYYPGQPIQWHLPRTTYDKCSRCGHRLGYLGRDRRACMGPCDGGALVYEATLTPLGFVREMQRINEERQPLRAGRRNTCGVCGVVGHNRATCPAPLASRVRQRGGP